jgi:hypothetical protein
VGNSSYRLRNRKEVKKEIPVRCNILCLDAFGETNAAFNERLSKYLFECKFYDFNKKRIKRSTNQ